MIVNAWVCFSLGGYVYVLFILVYVSALFKTSSNFWMHKGSSQLSSFPSARSPLDTEGVWLPQRLQAPISMNQRTRTGQNGRAASSLQAAHGRETADTQAALVVVQTQDQGSQITQGLGSLVCKFIPSSCTPKEWCPYLSSPFFYPFINICFLSLTKYVR